MTDPLLDIKFKVRALLDHPCDASDFARWLSAYAARANELVHSGKAGPSGNREAQRRDLLADLSRFQSDQLCIDWAHKHKLVLRDGVFYWWLNPENRVATLHALEGTTRGIPRITNGIDVWLELPDGRPFLGHRDNLKWERRGAPLTLKSQQPKEPKTKASKATRNLYQETADKMTESARKVFYTKYEAATGRQVPPNRSLASLIEEYMNAISILNDKGL